MARKRRLIGHPPIVTVARFGYALAPEHRAAITAAVPKGATVSPEAWQILEERIGGFRASRSRRTRYQIKTERKQWKRIADLVDQLTAELRPYVTPDSRLARAYVHLGDIDREITTREGWHQTWKFFRGNRDETREWLFTGVMLVWTNHLGGKLRYWRKVGSVGGPLPRFLDACVRPVLGDETPRNFDKAIDREKKARAHYAAEIAKWRQRLT